MTPEQQVLTYLMERGELGATVPEVQKAFGTIPPAGISRPGVRLVNLHAQGHAVRLCETRSGWPVWCTTENVRGRQIDVQQSENETDNEKESDMADSSQSISVGVELSDEARKVLERRSLWLLKTKQKRRVEALTQAAHILQPTKEAAKAAFTSPGQTPPAPYELIEIADYIIKGTRDA